MTALTAPVALAEQVRRLRAATLAPNTAKSYQHALARFDAFLDGHPATEKALEAFLAHEHARGIAPGSIAIVLPAIRHLEREYGRSPSVVTERIRTRLKALKREGRERGRGQVKGLSRKAVKRLAHAAQQGQTLAGLRDAALLLVMSDALLRIGEAVAIDCEHITAERDGSGRLEIPHSKTDQEGRGAVQYLTPRTMAAVDKLMAHPRAGYTTGPLFRRVRRGDWCSADRLTVGGARLAIKAAAQDAGIEGASGHSLRIGMAQELVQRGASLPELIQAGRWKDSQMPAHYTRRQNAGKGAVARLLADD